MDTQRTVSSAEVDAFSMALFRALKDAGVRRPYVDRCEQPQELHDVLLDGHFNLRNAARALLMAVPVQLAPQGWSLEPPTVTERVIEAKTFYRVKPLSGATNSQA